MTAVTTELPRRHFLTDEGEQLLVTRDALDAAERFNTFVTETGIDPDLVVADPVTIPLPIHNRGQRFDDVFPHALWNPLFWLPEDIALRIRIQETPNAEPRPEQDAEWALRIALEVSSSGLYDAETGWVDVFALYGINPEDPNDLEAIQAWQAGLPDERLDSIDLRDHVTFGVNHENFLAAQDLYPLIMAAQWGYTAASLLVALEADREAAALYATLGAAMLSAEPGDAPDQLHDAAEQLRGGGDPTVYGPSVVAAFESIVRDYAGAIYQLETELQAA